MNRWARMALYVFAFVLPWEDSLLLPLVGSLGRISGVLLLLFALPSLLRGRHLRLRRPSVFLVLMAALVTWSCLSLLWTLEPGASFAHALTRLQLLVLVWLLWQLLEDPASRLGTLRAYVMGCYVAIGSVLFNFVTGSEAVYQRYSATGTDPNDFATMLALGIPMAWLALHRGRNALWFWPMLVFLPAALGAILLTSSRGGALVTAVALLVVPLTFRSLPVPRRLGFWLVAVVAALGVAYIAPSVYDTVTTSLSRLSSTASELAEGTLNERADIWKAGLQLYGDTAPLGAGVGAFEESVSRYAGFPKLAHNTYLSVFVELGPGGLLLFGACLLAVAASVLRQSGVERTVLAVLLLTLILGLVPLTWEVRKVTWFVLVLLTAYGTHVLQGRQTRALAAA